MRTLREAELEVFLPEACTAQDVDLDAARLAILPAPGCLAVQVDPPRESHGGVFIPDTAQSRLRADCGTVLAAGAGVTVRSGERVLLRPYHGLWTEPFDSKEPAFVDVDDDGLRPMGRVVLIRPDERPRPRGIELAGDGGLGTTATGRVAAAGVGAWPARGSRVVYSTHHRRTGRHGLDRLGGLVAVEDRQVFATLGPSAFRAPAVRFYGAGTEWRRSILMVAREGDWQPVSPWVLIRRETGAGRGVELPEVCAARLRTRATVQAVGESNPDFASEEAPALAAGMEVVLDPNPRAALSFEFGASGPGMQLVDFKTIWAVIE